MTDQELFDTPTGAFTKSASTGKPVSLTLERGLKAKAQQRPSGSRGLLMWREQQDTRHPSRGTLERLALACGFLAPKYAEQPAGAFTGLMMTDGADYEATCQHDWGTAEQTVKGQTKTVLATCQRCGVTLATVTKTLKGQDSTKQLYDGHPVSGLKVLGLLQGGPVPEAMSSTDRAAFANEAAARKAQAKAAEVAAAPCPLGRPAQAPAGQPEAPAATSTSRPRPEVKGQVCGTCRHGELTPFNEIECQLGWAEHDPQFWVEYTEKERDGSPRLKTVEKVGKDGHTYKAKEPVTKWVRSSKAQLAHGGLELPLMSLHCRCMCHEGSKWLPKRLKAESD